MRLIITNNDVLEEERWKGRLTAIKLRALSPLKWRHINPYGIFTLNMLRQLRLPSALVA